MTPEDRERSHRTQIMLSGDQYEFLTDLAARRGVSMGRLVREAVEQYRAGPAVADDDISGLVGIGASGDLQSSEEHDDVIYRR